MTKSQRLSITAPARQRIPQGAISAAGAAVSGQEEVATSPSQTRRGKPGRPPKRADQKAKQISVTLFPRECDGLDKLLEEIHAHFGLPSNMIVRSQIARLAVLLLMELQPEQIWEELKRLQP